MKMRKILMVCSQLPPVYGGAGKQALALAHELVSRGVEITILTLNQGNASRVQSRDALKIRRVGPTGEPKRRSGRIMRSALLCGAAVKESLFGDYDLVHFHGAYWWTAFGGLAARLRCRPFLTKITRLGEDDAETVAAKRSGGVRTSAIYSYGIRGAARVVVLSREIQEGCQRTFPGVLCTYLPNGVDAEKFRPGSANERSSLRQQYGIPTDAFVVIHSGYLAPHKGVDTLLSAWQKTSQLFPGDAKLILAGPMDGFYRELQPDFVESLERASRSDDSVLILGHVDGEKMPELYRLADVYALLSHNEGMPNSLLEALASGLPSVVTSIPGISDIVAGSDAALQVAVRDDGATGVALCALADELASGDLQSRSRSARTLIENQYALSVIADRYLEQYEDILNG